MLVAGCADSGDGSGSAQGLGTVDGSPRRPVQLMLRARADRLMAGDVDGYLAPMSPEARAFEEPIARQAAKLGFSQIDLTVGEATISLDGAKFSGAVVTFKYRYKDLPEDNPFQLNLVYDLERQNDKWIITKSEFSPDSSFLPPPLWAIGPVEVTKSAHFIVMARPGSPRLAEMTSKAEAGLQQLLPQITLEVDKTFLMVLTDNDQDYESQVGESESLAAVGVEYRPPPGGRDRLLRPENRSMVVNVPLVFQSVKLAIETDRTPLLPQTVLQHELAHLVLSRFTRPCTDPWVIEGAATWLSGERRIDEWKAAVAAGLDPPSLAEMGTATEAGEPDPPADYPTANAAVLHLVERAGPAKFLDFYQNFKELLPKPPCKGRTRRTERASGSDQLLRRYYGIDIAGLDVATKDYISKAVAAG